MDKDLLKIPVCGAFGAATAGTGNMLIRKVTIGNATTYLGHSVALLPSVACVALHAGIVFTAIMILMVALHKFNLLKISFETNFPIVWFAGYFLATSGLHSVGLISKIAHDILLTSCGAGFIPFALVIGVALLKFDSVGDALEFQQ